jgi:hypothetical protein
MAAKSVTLTFQAPNGVPLAGGTVVIRLNQDASIGAINGPQVSANRTTVTTLNSLGSATISVWPNDQLFPSGSIYIVRAYSVLGQLVWSEQMAVAT